jgi:DNA replication protein DnaC
VSDGREDVLQWLEEQRAEALAERWLRVIPPRLQGARLGQLPVELGAPLDEWALEGTKNVVLFGPVGTGKTHAAVAAAHRALTHLGLAVGFWPVTDLLDQLRPGAEAGTMEAASRVGLLILDDLGAERPTDWTGERLYSILNHRWLHLLPTLVTCNATQLSELPELCGARVWSRLAQGSLLLRVTGPDRRLTNG